MNWHDDYFQRVRPVVGDLFRSRRVALWGLREGYLAATALAQSGIFHIHGFDDASPLAPGDGILRSLGDVHIGRSPADALEAHLRGHNSFEGAWELAWHPQDIDVLRRILKEDPPHLLLATLDHDAPQVLRTAIDQNVPTLFAWHPARGAFASLHALWHPDAKVDVDALMALVEDLATRPQLDTSGGPGEHINALEGRSLGLSLARWILAPDRPPRPDLARPLLDEGRSVMLRGDATWPWSVRFAAPSPQIAALAHGARPPYHAPHAFLGHETVLILGLGTASLFCAEAQLLGKRLVLLDSKEVSAFNPVRQIFSTTDIGVPKGRALADRLVARSAPGIAWQRRDPDAHLEAITDGEREILYGDLFLSLRSRGSLARFRKILDATRPTLAIVAMGRSKDDNFLATAELRRRGIRHITPTAFPGVSHFKHIITDGDVGPCYDCLQGHLAIDGGVGPTLQPAEREIFYGGTQPATLAETLPSAHSLLRIAADLSLPKAARPPYLRRELAAERNCFVGANRVEHHSGGWLYGVEHPFAMVSFGIDDIVGSRAGERCSCGRLNVPSSPDGSRIMDR
ncbi:MAG: hypothetical protein KAI47_01865 [Deltaproteobacteria bacterium]|nr:hypothetical protein [Deltaproteobacteria bacterium]